MHVYTDNMKHKFSTKYLINRQWEGEDRGLQNVQFINWKVKKTNL
jgi:hypothetical protein